MALMARRLCLLIIGVGLLPPFPALATVTSFQWWDDSEVSQAISLTSEQRQQISLLVHQSQERRKALRPEIAELSKTLSRLIESPVLDEAQILSTLTALSAAHFKQRKDVVLMRLQVRQVLAPEQFAKLLAVRPMVMRQRWLPRQPRAGGPTPTPPPHKTTNGP